MFNPSAKHMGFMSFAREFYEALHRLINSIDPYITVMSNPLDSSYSLSNCCYATGLIFAKLAIFLGGYMHNEVK